MTHPRKENLDYSHTHRQLFGAIIAEVSESLSNGDDLVQLRVGARRADDRGGELLGHRRNDIAASSRSFLRTSSSALAAS